MPIKYSNTPANSSSSHYFLLLLAKNMVIISTILKRFSITWKKILFIMIVVVLIIRNMIMRTDIYDWDSNTSLDLKVYVKPKESSTEIIMPNLLKFK